MKRYNPKEIEPKWQKVWEESDLYITGDDSKKENVYCLEMFPYTSGDLHTGHWYAYTGPDIMARFYRMQGNNVLHPFGFDAFGLPAENAAIKHNIPPAKWTNENIPKMTTQLKRLGSMIDWGKVISTADPSYYQWTQWLFLLLYKSGLAYKKKGLQNWCPKDQTVLANEQVVGDDNVCERCGTPVVKKELEQWFFKITDYAEDLLADLKGLDWPNKVITMQRNWIGRKEGIDITYKVNGTAEKITVFTTRPDTNFGATFIVLAPEHQFVKQILDGKLEISKEQKSLVQQYVDQTGRKTELERQEEGRKKTGIFTGFTAKNNLNNADLPVWVSDFVLADFGTGAVVGVPGHDLRDFEFATMFNIPIKRVVVNADGDDSEITNESQVQEESGKMINSEFLDGLDIHEAIEKMKDYLEGKGWGKRRVTYRLRDWLISRQRYWGAPIPIIYCDECGTVPVPEKDLPVKLPEDVEFKPTGQSPLLDIEDFVNTECPKCGKPARRETDTMDTFVDSSWYYLRYPNTKYANGAFDPQAVKTWLPVDHYLGGIEHAILHLLYSRFITKALDDHANLGFREPFLKLSNQGMILGPDGQKMSKSRGNVVNPDEEVNAYGADSFRAYLMFTGPWSEGGPYDTRGIAGTRRFLERVWALVQEFSENDPTPNPDDSNTGVVGTEILSALHKAIKRVTSSVEALSFNTAIAGLMELTNTLYKAKENSHVSKSNSTWQEALEAMVLLMAPFTPHIAEEMWHDLGNTESVHLQNWPRLDEKYLQEDFITIVVQVNGKVRANITMSSDVDEKTMVANAEADEKIASYLNGKTVVKTISVPQKLVNFVVK